MRIYQDAMEMIKEVERDLFEMGIRYQSDTVQDLRVGEDPGYRTIELTGYAYSLTGFEKLDEMVEYMGNNLEWARKEFDERWCPPDYDLNPGQAWESHRDKWKKFLRDGVFSYSYAERWQYQIPYVLNELRRRPNSRQAVMTVYDVHQDMMNWGGRDRVPCSMTYQFVLRNGRLTLIYNQRSCDFMEFFSTDAHVTCQLLIHSAGLLGVEPGRFVHFIGSLHAFAKDLEGRGIF
jgi:thymidylate synthase